MMKWIRDLKIGFKISCGFLLVTVIAGIIGIVGIVNLDSVGTSYHVAYEDSVTALECMERISASFQEIRTDLFEMSLAELKEDKEGCIEALNNHKGIIDDNLSKYRGILEKYELEEVEQELKFIDAIEYTLNLIDKSSRSFINDIAMDTERRNEAFSILSDGGELHALAQEMEGAITDLVEYNKDYSAQQIQANEKLAANSKLIMGGGILTGVIAAVFMGLFIARGISQRISMVVEAADRLAKGDLNVQIDISSKDETGMLAHTFRNMSSTLKAIIGDISYGLDEMSKGDFTVSSKVRELYVGDYAPIYESLNKMITKISDTLMQINMAAEQVATGSEQVSSGAQALAAGSTEQASSIEELSSSIEMISEQSAENSNIVETASKSVKQAGEGVSAGNEHMEQLTKAMADIGSASNQIANITKVIEDIAFQTNILALNAAIEAARAGAAGKGFAVVADEVRNLAAKSAEAAKQTGKLIEASVATVARGAEITGQTARILNDVGTSTLEVTGSFEKIERSSAEQAVAIEQIKQGLFQISAVVQTNAATAEENSATSEEMSAQAEALRQEAGKFKLA